MMSGHHVGAIIVAYYPEPIALKKLIRAITPQVQTVVVVDNTPRVDQAAWLNTLCAREQLHYLAAGHNRGIAAAQNQGIQFVLGEGADFCLLLDQDSLPSEQMVACLLTAYNVHRNDPSPIAAVGPYSYVPKLDIHIPFMTVSGSWYEKRYCISEHQSFWVNHLIASGTLIPRSAINAIGLMEESLFIDYVDIEWCLRANAQGYRLLGCCAATMEHDLGDAPLTLLGQRFLTHSPLRHYYLVRNAILLYQKSYIPWRWKFNDGLRVSLKLILYGLFLTPRRTHMRMALLGFIDGLRGRSGMAPIHKNALPKH